MVGHRGEPDVDVEADLVAGMAADHRAAARLRHVADQQAIPAVLGGVVGERLDVPDEFGLAPVAVARQPHHLPVRPGDRQRLGAGHAAVGIGADRPWLARRGQLGLAEQHFGWRAGGKRRGAGSGHRRHGGGGKEQGRDDGAHRHVFPERSAKGVNTKLTLRLFRPIMAPRRQLASASPSTGADGLVVDVDPERIEHPQEGGDCLRLQARRDPHKDCGFAIVDVSGVVLA